MKEMNKNKSLNGKRIGIFGKGGAGKSTVTLLLASELVRHEYTVIVLDADSTNLGLSRIFQIEDSPRSLMEFFGGTVFHGGRVTCPVDDPTPLENAEVSLDSLDNEFYACNPQGILFFVAGKIGGEGPGAGCDGPVAKIARDFRVTVHNKKPVTLIDFKAGLEDIARGVITSLDLAIFIVDASLVSVEMAANMKDIIARIRSHELPATAHLENPGSVEWANRFYKNAHIAGLRFILNRISSKDEEDTLTRLLRDKGIMSSCTIYQNPMISTAWLKGAPLNVQDIKPEIQSLVISSEKDIEDYSRKKSKEDGSS